jgi:type IV secretory pathway VirB2 component (pilin)
MYQSEVDMKKDRRPLAVVVIIFCGFAAMMATKIGWEATFAFPGKIISIFLYILSNGGTGG